MKGERVVANCGLCGNKIGFVETISREFPNDFEGTCTKCHKEILGIKEMLEQEKQIDGFDECASKLSEKYSSIYSSKGMQYFNKVIANNREKLEKEYGIKQEQQILYSEMIKLNESIKSHQLTTGYNFEGYNIKEYLGVISGSTVIGTGLFSEFFASASDLFGTESNAFSDKMEQVKDSAMKKLIAKSASIGGNALIGIDYDFINFSSNMIGVSANGTAVVIEKESE